MTIENRIDLLQTRLNRLVTRSMDKDNAGVRRKIEREIRNLKRELAADGQREE